MYCDNLCNIDTLNLLIIAMFSTAVFHQIFKEHECETILTATHLHL